MSLKCSYPLRSFSNGTSVVAQGGRMAVTVQRQCESVVTEMYQDAFVGSSLENGATMITFDLRKRDFQRALGANCRRFTIRFCTGASSRRVPT